MGLLVGRACRVVHLGHQAVFGVKVQRRVRKQRIEQALHHCRPQVADNGPVDFVHLAHQFAVLVVNDGHPGQVGIGKHHPVSGLVASQRFGV